MFKVEYLKLNENESTNTYKGSKRIFIKTLCISVTFRNLLFIYTESTDTESHISTLLLDVLLINFLI